MALRGPQAGDYQNVVALNRAYLSLLQAAPGLPPGLAELSSPLRQRLRSLTRQQRARLADTPFLLLSLRERDDLLWEQLLGGDAAQRSLSATTGDEFERLRAAALGFVWQLARQNPYSLRLTCGASVHWCERIAEHTFFGLLAAAAPFPELLVLRRADDQALWQKLLGDGVSRDLAVRRAAQMSALQTVLTRQGASVPAHWAVAACKASRPGLQIADE